MKKILLIAILAVAVGCKKDSASSGDGKLHVEYTGFTTGSHNILLTNQTGKVVIDQQYKTGNASYQADVNKGDVINGSQTISGDGAVKITYNGVVKFATSHGGSGGSGGGPIPTITIN